MGEAIAAEPTYDQAVSLYLRGQYYSCLEACECILAAKPDDPPTLHLIGMLCYRAGDLNTAAAWFRRCLAVAPDHAEAHIDLALVLKKQGKLEEAVASYRTGLDLDAGNAQAHYNLGLALRMLGRASDAAESFRSAVAIQPTILDGFNALGLTETELGNLPAAAEAFRKAIAAAPENAAAYRNLAEIGRRMGRPEITIEALRWGVGVHGNRTMGVELAKALEDSGEVGAALGMLRATLAEAPDLAEAWETLGGLHFRQHRFADSLEALRKCVEADPARADVHMRIHTMAQIVGQRELALEHQRRALEITRLFTERGADPARPHLLVLKAAGDWQANLPTDFLLRAADWGAIHTYFVAPDSAPDLDALPPCDAVFNAVAEPDLTRGELAQAESVVAALGKPVLNRPDRVAATGRADVAFLLADLPDSLVPTVLRLSPASAEAELKSAIGSGRIAPPLLLRPAGTHAGQGVRLVEAADGIDLALAALAGSDLYATRFVDYRNADGLFRKYRVILVDGVPYPFHMAISKRWLVHYYNAVNDDPAMMDREEERFLADFETVFPARLRNALAEMARRLGLDFFGVDCSIAPDGRLLLFEVDVGVIVHLMDDPKRHPYKHRHVPRIFEAVRRMVEARIERAAG